MKTEDREKARYEFIEQSDGDGFLVEVGEELEMDRKEWKEEHEKLVKEHRGKEDFREVYIASLRKGDKIK